MDGAIMGTPQYMSPEQARGEVETLAVRSDIYALGAILYHLLALRPPVTGRTAMEIVDKVARGEVEPLECGGKRQRDAALAGAERRGGSLESRTGPGMPRRPKAVSALRSATALQTRAPVARFAHPAKTRTAPGAWRCHAGTPEPRLSSVKETSLPRWHSRC